MSNGKFLARVLTGALLLGAATVGSPEAAGPWKGQILDAETGQPLEGVVVLAQWITYTASLAGWAGGGFYDAEEVVTGLDGHFVIPARSTVTLVPWKKISGPEFVIFKPGYGQWRFRGSQDWPQDLYQRDILVKQAWEQLRGEGVVIELPPLKTREERLEFIGRVGSSSAPPEYTKRLDEAVHRERRYLGLH